MISMQKHNFVHFNLHTYNCILSFIDQRHFSRVKTALLEVSARWKEVGRILSLGDDLSSLDQMITKWLNKSTAKDPPTLRRLVGAIATQQGGRNPTHAERVARMFEKGVYTCLIMALSAT